MEKQTNQNITEKRIYDFWIKEKFFNANPKSGKKSFSLLVPPPNLTGELHLGHAMQHSILDAIARYKRLVGYDVLLLPGVDHAGIAFESTFNKYLKKRNVNKEKLGREKWLEEAWKFKDSIYRPGVIADRGGEDSGKFASVANSHWYNYWPLTVAYSFRHDDLPIAQFLSSTTDDEETVFFDLVRLSGTPNIGR